MIEEDPEELVRRGHSALSDRCEAVFGAGTEYEAWLRKGAMMRVIRAALAALVIVSATVGCNEDPAANVVHDSVVDANPV
jgi:hypothetical protein